MGSHPDAGNVRGFGGRVRAAAAWGEMRMQSRETAPATANTGQYESPRIVARSATAASCGSQWTRAVALCLPAALCLLQACAAGRDVRPRALAEFATSGDLEGAQALLSEGADVNEQDNDGSGTIAGAGKSGPRPGAGVAFRHRAGERGAP